MSESIRLASGLSSDAPEESSFDPAAPRVRTISVRHESDEKPRAMPAVVIPTPAPLSLVFDDALLEHRFRFYLFHKRLGPLRIMLPLLLVVLMGLGLHEVLILQRYVLTSAICRFGIELPLILCWYLGSHTQVYMYQTHAINVALGLIIGGINVAMSVLGGDPDHGPQMLYYFLVFMFLQLRVLAATVVCWMLFVSWVVAVHFFVPEFDRLILSSSYMAVSCLALMTACYFVEYWMRVDFVRHHLLILEERKTNDLLATLLPERITEQLRNLIARQTSGVVTGEEELIAEDHPNVSILFSDIVGFTQYSATITAQEVVSFLSSLYTVLDYLTSEHEVLKVETIGDAYFVASGVLVPRDDHCTLLANFAFAMQLTVKKFRLKGGKSLHMRIGLHSGRVIAGVVGLKVPRYHLFGESVAIAALMEQTGQPDRIQISNLVAADLARWTDDQGQDMYELEPRVDPKEEAAEMKAKRNGMETYWLTDPNAGMHGITPAFVQPSRSRTTSAAPVGPLVLPAAGGGILTESAPSSFNPSGGWKSRLAAGSFFGAAGSGSVAEEESDAVHPPPMRSLTPVVAHVAPPRKVTMMHSNAHSNARDDSGQESELEDADEIPGPPQQRPIGGVRTSMSRL